MNASSRVALRRGLEGVSPAVLTQAAVAAYRRWPTVFGAFPATFATGILIQFVTLGSGIALARSLGPDGRGDLAAAMLWPGLLLAIGDLGLEGAVTFFAGRETERKSPVLSTVLVVGMVKAAVLMVAGYFLLPLVLASRSPEVIAVARTYLWFIPLNQATVLPVMMLLGRMDMRAFNLTRFAPHISYTALLLILWAQGQVSVPSAAAASLLSVVFTLLVCIVVLLRGGYWTSSTQLSLLRPMLSFGAKIHLGNVTGMVGARLDVTLLATLASSEALGFYVAAGTVGAMTEIIPSTISMIIYPSVVGRSIEQLRAVVARVLLVGIALTAVSGPILLALVPWVVYFFFGRTFESAIPLARVLLLTSFARGWNGVMVGIMRGAGWPGKASIASIVGLVVSAALLPPLVWQLGSMGAAMAVTCSAVAGFIWILTQLCLVTHLTPFTIVRSWHRDLTHLPALYRALVVSPKEAR